ncbi:hypothetical protein AQV86_05605 [Nanohaloarchaea archaeon SG9]|nr:hypothetical protein AQV86_05605 [Nanohaloarchaea archaeon SG9]
MKFNQKHTLMALVTLTLIASGCTGGGEDPNDEAAGSNPIQATSFTASPNPAPNGNKVTFTLELANNGNIDAENVVGKLWNPPFGEGDRVWSDADNGGVSVSDRSFSFGTLQGQEEGVETFAKPKTLRLTAPTLDEGQSFPYNFKVEYAYKYSTNGETTITVMESDQYRESGGEKSRTVNIDHNSAPISLEGQLLSGNPIVYYDGDEPPKEPEFCVVVSNDGGGTVFSNPTGNNVWTPNGDDTGEYTYGNNKNMVDLTVESVGSTGVRDPDDQGSSYSSTASDTVELISGDEARKCFQLRVGSLANAGSQMEIGPININAEYGYAENTGTQVTVNSR